MRFVCIAFMSVAFACNAVAGLVVNVEADKIFDIDSGIHQIDLLITGSPDSIGALGVDISISGGVFAFNDNGFSSLGGLTKTGIFGQTGYVGFGNFVVATSGLAFDDGDPQIAFANFDFINQQPISDIASKLLTLTIDVNGLSPGEYDIAFANSFASVPVIFNSGSFTISEAAAVPEPLSTMLIAAGGFAAIVRLRRSRSNAQKLAGL